MGAFTAEPGLAGLFLASFLSATLLPGGSEAVLFAVIRLHPEQTLPALLPATLGNTLGGMLTYFMGRLLPQHLAPEKSALARRRGPPVLLLAWAPIIVRRRRLRLPCLLSAPHPRRRSCRPSRDDHSKRIARAPHEGRRAFSQADVPAVHPG